MKKEKQKKNHVPIRLNILFLIVFLLFSVLIVQLANVQIVKNEDFKKEVARQGNSTVSMSVPRGKIYDHNGKVVVDNEQQRAITYTRYTNVANKDMLTIAKDLAKYIDVPTDKIQQRDKKDYWLITRDEEGDKLVSKEEQKALKEQKKTDDDIYKLRLERVTDAKLAELDDELEIVSIFSKMKSGYKMTPQIIKNEEVTDAEFAIVSERLESLPGVDVTSDWKRSYPNGDALRSVLGSVSKDNEGLPSENLQYYLVRDYNRNDRVGKSYIEQQYEDVLHGKKKKVKTNLDKDGKTVLDTEVIYPGESGSNLNLTFDAELQAAVEEIIIDEMKKYKQKPGYDVMDRAFVVMMDPYTGEVRTMAGKQIDEKGEFKDYALGTMSSAYQMGSVVKGATVLTGYQTGAIKENQVIRDQPYYFGSSEKPKKSWISNPNGMGEINDLEALKRSSNVYMFRIVMNMMKAGPYTKGMPLPLPGETNVFEDLRYYFGQFGLGVPTGIDLPNEALGFKGEGENPGLALDIGIGQYDTYTTLQLAQYISTIANGGYRMKPQILHSITEASNKPDEPQRVIETIDPVVMNRIDMPLSQIKRVQEGFRMVGQSGGTASAFFGSPHNPALKTGTAESRTKHNDTYVDTYNYTLVGYAPYETAEQKPEIAFAVAVPGVRQTARDNKIAQDIGKRAMEKYFELKKARGLNGKLPNEESNTQSQSGTDSSTNNEQPDTSGQVENNEQIGNNNESEQNEQDNMQQEVGTPPATREESDSENSG
ncbi:peptidoglycan D,D-transpeptidase FtsI family protein [Priestia taiwanensis]|uniref:serine-type D-Ala-D-Ala carboxypeptidase n=1 Tax=Priestia taiwanensis TaxID=1347902 RepID=A0A917EQ60_9BACI|nr:penicillin-binding protein 2 [Priestia taiwanensis]MBM7363789.1 cell division protein FtsI/penicillin-binding protein 2 [Priestia taiwanensis]GGE74073.1 penicillin-binding protein [Priestia taiwanensis]